MENPAPPAYVYMVRCADGTLYTGWTTDVARRVAEHNAGRGAAYTRQRGPVTLVYCEAHPDRSTAMRREEQIKRRGRAYKERLLLGRSPCGAAGKS
ncbi:MAG TPA: GIY-YIG nuclease family protein [Anaerolineae bacterium]|nr:GIY-YIG nuclease family protein [Anaerolineae bacterium]HNU04138.1 GIY-YIG nuclease family protein [Anaerolineae bacterium]